MNKALFLVGLGLTLLLNVSLGQSKDSWKVKFDLFQNHGEMYLRFRNTGKTDLQAISKIISIDKPGNDIWVYAYATEKQIEKFETTGIFWEPLQHPSTLIKPKMLQSINRSEILDWDFYPTYEAYVDLMYQFETDFPGLCKVVNIGQSVEGRDLLFVVISDNISQAEEGEPQFMYTSSMHGDETTGYVLCLHLIDYLLSNYETNLEVNELINKLEIWINPLANPDGTYAGGNSTVSGATRNNAHLVNLNRNYPDPDDGLHPDGNVYQAETEAFMALADDQHFIMSANFHGGAEVYNYPWDTYQQLHPDDAWWIYVGRQWADTVHFYGPAGYFNDLNNGITNGYFWYTITGGRQDYMNYYHHCREVTIELSNTKLLPASQFPNYWQYQYRSLINYMKQVMYGIQGQVQDSISGIGLNASVFVENHDELNTWIASNGSEGWYFRPIMEGTYDLTFFVEGYNPKTIQNVEVQNGVATQLNVLLAPTGSGSDEYLSKTDFIVGPNPFGNKIFVRYSGQGKQLCNLEIFSSTGKSILNKSVDSNRLMSGYFVDLPNCSEGLLYLKISYKDQHQLWKLIHFNQ